MPATTAPSRTRLLPGKRLEVQQRPTPMRRGRGTTNPQYAQGVHSDGPLTVENYAENVRAFAGDEAHDWWLERYRRDDVAGARLWYAHLTPHRDRRSAAVDQLHDLGLLTALLLAYRERDIFANPIELAASSRTEVFCSLRV